jgi:hypothetical protein
MSDLSTSPLYHCAGHAVNTDRGVHFAVDALDLPDRLGTRCAISLGAVGDVGVRRDAAG